MILDAATCKLHVRVFLFKQDVSMRCLRGSFPATPGATGAGWVDLLDVDALGNVLADVEGNPISRRYTGLVRWEIARDIEPFTEKSLGELEKLVRAFGGIHTYPNNPAHNQKVLQAGCEALARKGVLRPAEVGRGWVLWRIVEN